MNIPFLPRISRKQLQDYLVAVLIVLAAVGAVFLLPGFRESQQPPPIIGAPPPRDVQIDMQAVGIVRDLSRPASPIQEPGPQFRGRDNPFLSSGQEAAEAEELEEANE